MVEDIQSDPLWKEFKEVAGRHGLGACWSQPIRASDGRILGTTAIYFPTTRAPVAGELKALESTAHFAGIAIERPQAQAALRESEKNARQASVSKSEFLANMSHEIRTPMAAILGHADVLLTHLKDADNRGCVDTIKRNGNHLLELINDILDLSRIEAGKLDVELESCKLAEILADIWSLMHIRVEGRAVDLQVVCDGKLPTFISTDPKRLRQVLINLIGNAIKFTEEGQVKLLTSCVRREEQYAIRFEVQDTGIGISQEHMTKLFKPFSQADSSVTRKFGGTGLGLSISKRLVSMLGGQLTVASQLGVGSTFCVELPVGELKDVAFSECEIEKVSNEAEAEVARRKESLNCRILLVDDRRDVRFLAQHILEGAGAVTVTATDGREGIAAIRTAEEEGVPFDIVVMDMQMPIMDGYAATSELRAKGFNRPIIAMTANAMAGDAERCLNVGCDDYQSKPVDAAELISKVRRLTETISLETLQANRDQRKAAMRNANSAETNGNHKRVLVVDPSVDAARATAALLELEGYRTTLCHSGQAAMHLITEASPSCMVMDVALPDMNGQEIARELRRNGFRGLLIALSNKTEKDQDLLEAGFDHQLMKPAPKGKLVELISAHADKSGLAEDESSTAQ